MSEKRKNDLAALFDLLPAMIWFKDTEDRILRVNQRAAEAVGMSIREMEGKISQELHPKDLSSYHADDLEVIRTGKPKLGILESLRGSEGKEIWVQTNKVPFRNSEGTIVGIVAMAQDVTNQKITEEALRDSEEKFRLLMENLTDALWIQSPDMKTLHYLSPGGEQIWGRPVEELMANHHAWMDFLVPEDRERISTVFNTLTDEAPQVDVDYRIIRPDGEIRWVHARGYQVRDATGKLVNLTGIVTDITERKRAEDTLNLLTSAVEQTKESILITDARLDQPGPAILFVNHAFTVMTGYTEEEVLGKTPRILHGPLTNREVLARLRRDLSAGKVFEGETLNYRKDGKTYHLEWQITPILDINGDTTNYVSVQRDVTRRRQDEEELRWKSALLEAKVDSYDVGILVVDCTGRQILQNRRMVDLWKIPWAIAESEDDSEQLNYVLGRTIRPEQFLEKVNYLYAHPDECSADEIELIDGTVLDRYSAPVIGKDGRNYGRIWTFTDITAKKGDETERAKLNRQLLEVSRQAGMAEVATNVLHNVGNVLNSVNISCSVISSRIRKSRISGVVKTAELLQNHQGDLAGFFTNDPGARKLPEYLGLLADDLLQEQAGISAELRSLSENIEHIKDVVGIEQNLASVSGVTETVVMQDLIEDALRLGVGSLTRHRVRVVREYSETPPVTVEKHKILQILINLIGNAKSACSESGRGDKQIILRLTADSETVRIAVIDNGVGIPPGNLTRIFAYGFTTKAHGHGFGLPSSALVAREMGGDLKVHSDGSGKGAAFTLILPVTGRKPL